LGEYIDRNAGGLAPKQLIELQESHYGKIMNRTPTKNNWNSCISDNQVRERLELATVTKLSLKLAQN
jgi:hypothetical protein